ncbi:faeA-like family protein [Salmonella enterica subsp. salamae]|uniref:FaeA-like family protein n=1 Tax=Salmonella enterica subsp. salamae TaxID=59202 RepID=A0A5Y3V2L2_SALER|nr:faeA-like family protein [Salmonella enterica subsp. salamae]ECI3454276.1 faeA-like family protein [Salmonella enterica subsp. salamae]ECJ2327114.1 faeA-like family protein [Salmonella enterica subsp. salamae]EEO8344807.1 faeA-like family protein [Salmonella enterica]
MSHYACGRILSFIQSQAKGRENISVKTQIIVEVAGLARYQASSYLKILQGAGGAEKMNAGKGVSGLWRLV